jgi:hypothetical protein
VIYKLVEVPTKSELDKRAWKVVNWLIELGAEGELKESGREVVYRLVKLPSKSENREGWEMVHKLVKPTPKGEVGEGWWKTINSFIKIITKCEFCKRGGEVVHRMGEKCAKRELDKGGW